MSVEQIEEYPQKSGVSILKVFCKLTEVLSKGETTYHRILRYIDNAYFYLRYGLQDYFKDSHISVPQYRLDTEGFMVHPITGKKLCPFN